MKVVCVNLKMRVFLRSMPRSRHGDSRQISTTIIAGLRSGSQNLIHCYTRHRYNYHNWTHAQSSFTLKFFFNKTGFSRDLKVFRLKRRFVEILFWRFSSRVKEFSSSFCLSNWPQRTMEIPFRVTITLDSRRGTQKIERIKLNDSLTEKKAYAKHCSCYWVFNIG